MATNLIKCGVCENNGLGQALASVTPSGDVEIKRILASSNGGHFTLVRGDNFEIICGMCGAVAYRKDKNESPE